MSKLRVFRSSALVLAAAGLVQQLLIVVGSARHVVSEDQALLWAAARDWGHLRPRQPNFWGQRYGVTFEAIPAELLRRVGVGFPTGLPLTVAAMGLVAWWLPGFAAIRRGHRALGLAALAAPLVLSSQYAVMGVVYNTAFARLLASLVLAAVVLRPAGRLTPALVVAAGGLAVQFDTSTALVVIPALVVLIAERMAGDRPVGPVPPGGVDLPHRRDSGGRRETVIAAVVGAGPPVAWAWFTRRWYARHPDDAMHPAPTLHPTFGVLLDNLSNPTRHFTDLAPELWHSPVVVVAVVAALAVVGRRRQRPAAQSALAAVVGLGLLILALPRSRDGFATVYYPVARVLLPLPIALWCCAWLLRSRSDGPETGAGSRRSGPPFDVRRSRPAVAVVIVLAVVSCGLRLARWDGGGGGVDRLFAGARGFENYPLTPVPEMVGRCDRIARAAAAAHTAVVLDELRTTAYACAGLQPSLMTLYPPYERRAWVLRRADDAGPGSTVIDGTTPVACGDAGLACTVVSDGLAVVTLDGISPLDAARRLGVVVRPYVP